MFTDWTLVDPRYFYARGVLYGVVLTALFFTIALPWIRKKLGK